MRFPRLVSAASLGLAVALGASASGALADGLDVGGTAQLPALVVTCSPGTLYFQAAVGAAPGYTTPSGVVTSWSTMGADTDPGAVALEVGRPGAPHSFTIVGGSAPMTITANGVDSFLSRIPVQAGDVLGLDVVSTATEAGCAFISGTGGDVLNSVTVPGGLASPSSTYVTTTSSSQFRLNLSARVEPDADGDGWGDLTQDACPTLANSHTDCTPPDTLLATAPGKVVTKKRAARATIVFYASEAATTHTCTVDAGAAAPCTSPFTPKLSAGRHTVRITSTDAVGNVDPTPLAFTVKVKRKR